jgi:hypothetical protein
MTPKLAKIAAELLTVAYEHDPNILKEHEQAAKDKLKQLSSDVSDPETLRKDYHDKIKEFTHKPVSPDDVSSILHVYDNKEAGTEVVAEDVREERQKALQEASVRGAVETVDTLTDLLDVRFSLEDQHKLAEHIKMFFTH